MSPEDLAKELRRMYEYGYERNVTVAMIHLFGIKYADEIEACDVVPKDLCCMAGLPESYGREVSKGRRLAHFVDLKPRAARL